MGWTNRIADPQRQQQKSSIGSSFLKGIKMMSRQMKLDSSQRSNVNEDPRSKTELVDASFWKTIRELSWCPVLRQNPYPGVLPWYYDAVPNKELAPLAKPKDMQAQSEVWMCSGTPLLLADSVDISMPLKRKLGWDSGLGADVLVSQLLAIGKLHGETVRDPKVLQQLTVQIPLIYSGLLNTEMKLAINSLRNSPIIWTGDGFVEPKRVAMKGSTSLKPLLFSIPQDLLCFSAVLEKMGVVEEFSSSIYIEFLEKLPRNLHQSQFSMKEIVWISLELAGKIDAFNRITDKDGQKRFLEEEGFPDLAVVYSEDKKTDFLSKVEYDFDLFCFDDRHV